MVIAKDNTIHNVEVYNNTTYNNSVVPGIVKAVYYTNSTNERIQLYTSDSNIDYVVIDGVKITGAYYTFVSAGNHTVTFYLKSNTFNPAMFRNREYVRSITIGKNITEIKQKTINSSSDGYWFTRAFVESGNPFYDTRGYGVVETATNKLVLGGAETTIASTVTTLGSYAFAYAKNSNTSSPGTSTYMSFVIPRTVTEIENYCFNRVGKLHRIDLYGRPTLSQYSLQQSLGQSNTSELHIRVGTSIAGTLWYDDLIYDRGWILCVDL